jgi:hypothetical protein
MDPDPKLRTKNSDLGGQLITIPPDPNPNNRKEDKFQDAAQKITSSTRYSSDIANIMASPSYDNKSSHKSGIHF